MKTILSFLSCTLLLFSLPVWGQLYAPEVKIQNTGTTAGSIGIGTETPGAKFEVDGQDVNFFNNGAPDNNFSIGRNINERVELKVEDLNAYLLYHQDADEGNNHSFIIENLDTVGNEGSEIRFKTDAVTRMVIQQNGVVRFRFGIQDDSDRILKNNIKQFSHGLDILEKINPVTFRFKYGFEYKQQNDFHVGVVAQDVQQVAPFMVNTSLGDEGEETLAVRSMDFIYLLINAVKEQQAQIQALQTEVDTLKKDK